MNKKNNKVIAFSELNNILSKENRNGQSVVHCHGVFDLLHIGHIKYFQEASTLGNMLIVTVTPDIYVNKGPNRPVFNEQLRAKAIAALDVVDYVAVNKWPTAVETIKRIKPDYYVKGPDYKDSLQDVTGNIELESEAIKSVGGKIIFTSNSTYSASKIINGSLNILSDEQKAFLSNIKNKYSFDDIVKYIERLSNLKVLLIGEAIIDEYVFCNSIGKSGKEPILINQKINSEKYAGGSLAIANHLSSFCREVTLINYLGDRSDHKEFILNNLNKNVKLRHIVKKNSPTILKTRFIDSYSNAKFIGIYDLNNDLLTLEEEEQICSILNATENSYDLVIAADYGHGLITSKIVNVLESKAKFLSVNTQLNAFNIGYHTISKYKNANYICVHEGELRYDHRNRTDTVEHLTRSLSKKIKSDLIVITKGKSGSLAFMEDRFISCPAYAGKLVDRIGAGDTLLAITSLCAAKKVPIDITLFLGNLAAAEMIASTGTGKKLSKANLLNSVKSLLS